MSSPRISINAPFHSARVPYGPWNAPRPAAAAAHLPAARRPPPPPFSQARLRGPLKRAPGFFCRAAARAKHHSLTAGCGIMKLVRVPSLHRLCTYETSVQNGSSRTRRNDQNADAPSIPSLCLVPGPEPEPMPGLGYLRADGYAHGSLSPCESSSRRARDAPGGPGLRTLVPRAPPLDSSPTPVASHVESLHLAPLTAPIITTSRVELTSQRRRHGFWRDGRPRTDLVRALAHSRHNFLGGHCRRGRSRPAVSTPRYRCFVPRT